MRIQNVLYLTNSLEKITAKANCDKEISTVLSDKFKTLDPQKTLQEVDASSGGGSYDFDYD
ncbi:MAG: hypothetical protein WC627_10005 [Legionella sp.]|jgi:hypothetical protein